MAALGLMDLGPPLWVLIGIRRGSLWECEALYGAARASRGWAMFAVRSNLAGMHAAAMLQRSQGSLSGSLERLSSGQRVTSAADDAAGLGVAVNLETQSSSIRTAMRNANDGIDLLQTAEGAADSTTDMLQRMRELSVQSSSETLDDDERSYLQTEFNEYIDEIRDVSRNTEFNGIVLTDALRPTIDVQVGAGSSADNRVTLDMPDLRSVWATVRSETVATVSGANDAIEAVDTALGLVNDARSVLGAGHNRLLHAIGSAEASVTALSSAESQIIDLDFALESSALTRHKLLQQAGVASAAQANEIGRSVLGLL